MKTLPPTLRNKKRYIAIRVFTEKKIDRKELVHGIWNNTISLFGDYGAAKTGLWVHDFDGEYAIIECHHQYRNEIEQILSITHFINEKRTKIEILGVSGTINKVKKKFIQTEEE